MNNVSQQIENVKENVKEEIRQLSELIRASLNREEQNKIRFQLAEKLDEVHREKIYRELGYSSFHEFARDITGLNWRTVRYLIEAYRFARNRPEIFIKHGYRKVNALARVYSSAEEVPENLDLSVARINSEVISDDFEAEKRKLIVMLKEYGAKYGAEELKEAIRKAVQQLKEEERI